MLGYDQIIGHDELKEHFKAAVMQNKISHAYLLNGEKGCGKSLLARTFAAALQCTTETENRPCGDCVSCKQTESGNHPDIIWVTHDKKSIGVDVIREQITGTIDIKPYSSPYKVYIVRDADKMTEQAQNALLKTIEEPPAYAVLILLTANLNALLPTVLSRCITLNFHPISSAAIKEYLMNQCGVPDDLADMSAVFAQGNLGRGIRYATSEHFLEIKDEVIHLLRYKNEMKIHEMVDAVKRIKENKEEVKDYIDLMVLWYRDVLLFKATHDTNHLIFKDEYRYISDEAGQRGYEKLEEILRAFEKAKLRLDFNVNFDVAMELMLLTIKD